MSGQIIGLNAAMRKLTSIHKQVKFATAQGLNDTAKDVQQFTVGTLLPDKFTLRARGAPWYKPGTKQGFNIKFASKNRLQSVIGSQFEPMGPQEKGGAKQLKSDHRVAIPTAFHKPKAQIMARGKKPRRILANKSAFIGKGKIAGGIWARTTDKRLPIRRLFSLKDSVRIKAVLQFGPSGLRVALRQYQKHFDRRLLNAIATAK